LLESIEKEYTNSYNKFSDEEKKNVMNETAYGKIQEEIAAAKKDGDNSFEKWAGDNEDKQKKVVAYLEDRLTGINSLKTTGAPLIGNTGVFPETDDPRKEKGEGSASKEGSESVEEGSASEAKKEGSVEPKKEEESTSESGAADKGADEGGSKSKRSNHKRTKRKSAKHIGAKHIGTKRKRKSAKHIGAKHIDTKHKRKSAKHKRKSAKRTTAKKH